MEAVWVDRAQRGCLLFVAAGWLVIGSATAQQDRQFIAFEMRPGDTLWDITSVHLDDMSRLQTILDENGIEVPAALQPGTVVEINADWFVKSDMPVTVSDLNGHVEIQRGDTVELLNVGTLTQPRRSKIRSGEDGRATLTFANSSTITIEPNSVLALDQIEYLGNGLIPDIAVTLEMGNASVTYPNQGLNRGRLDIRTRSAITSVRGTEFRMGFDGGSARAETLGGVIEFGNDQARIDLPSNFGSIAKDDAPPLAPIGLPDPPSIDNLPAVIAKVPFQATFPAVEGAAAYRLLLYPQGQPLAVLQERTVATTVIDVPDLPDGNYVLQASSIEANGLQGQVTTHDLEVNALPAQPMLQDPINQGRIITPQPEFAWTALGDQLTFGFELALNGDFSQPAQRIDGLETTDYTLPVLLQPGTYHWRVTATDALGDTGQPSLDETFRYAPPPPAVEPTLSLNDDGRLIAQWAEPASELTYLVELSSDQTFKDRVHRLETKDSLTDLGKPRAGENWLQITTIDADGIKSEPSERVVLTTEQPPWWQLIGLPVALLALILLL